MTVYVYVVDRDFGFAPNPFHGCCTLATCKPVIRRVALIDSWVVGVGGGRLHATGRCVFAMKITETLSFDEYWSNPAYYDKRPVRNGSRRMMVGDNIYHRDSHGSWVQADSHHSRVDGTPDMANLEKDTSVDKVLISRHFYYFGREAPLVPDGMLSELGFRNGQGHFAFDDAEGLPLIRWIETSFRPLLNQVACHPFDFHQSNKRYDGESNSIR